MQYEEWVRCGERLQLAGEDLVKFVERKEEEFHAREERARQREDQNRRREDEQRMLEMQHEFQMKEQELQLERLRAKSQGEESVGNALRPKLPKFDERLDDMDAYLERFERFAKGQGWDMETWATSLSSLLTGKGLEVYTSMPPEEANSYSALKLAVLKRYQLTEDGFRTKFRESKPEVGETVFQYVARLRRYFSRWVEMAGTDGTYESIFDMLLREQFIASCSPEIAVFLKERAPTSITEVTRLAEQYVAAHGGKLVGGRSHAQRRVPEESDKRFSQPGADKNGEGSKDGSKTKSCFLCGKPGHFARECGQRRNTYQGSRRMAAALTLGNGEVLPVMEETECGTSHVPAGANYGRKN